MFSPPRMMMSLIRPVMRTYAVGVDRRLVAGAEPAVAGNRRRVAAGML